MLAKHALCPKAHPSLQPFNVPQTLVLGVLKVCATLKNTLGRMVHTQNASTIKSRRMRNLLSSSATMGV